MKKIYLIKLLSIFTFFLGFSNSIFAQNGNMEEGVQSYTPQVAPPSPTAFQFSEHGNISLNGNSGGFNYSIPIYTIEHHDIKMPMSVDYFSNGVKVDELSGILGTDWNLNAGGMVTRLMRGIPDDRATERWYVWNPELYDNQYNIDKLVSIARGDGYYDSEPDWFSFNVNGLSGSFYLDENLEPHLNGNEQFKIEFKNHHSGRGYGMRSTFTIIDNHGYQYIFGGEEHDGDNDLYLEANRSYRDCFTGPQDKYYSTWYLKEIISPNNNIITFTYAKNNFSYATNISDNIDIYTPCSPDGDYIIPGYRYKYSFCQYRSNMESKVLSKISFGNRHIDFEYEDTRKDGAGKSLKTIKIYNKETILKTISFNYNEVKNKNAFVNSKLQNNSSLKYRLFLESIIFNDRNSEAIEKYNFDYHNKSQLPNRLSYSKDLYGYNNGSSNTKPFSKTLKSSFLMDLLNQTGAAAYATADLEVNPSAVYYGMMKEITYPTGGYSQIKYEANSNIIKKEKLVYNSEYIPIKKDCNENNKTESFTFTSNGTSILLSRGIVTLDDIHNNGQCEPQSQPQHDKYYISIKEDGVPIYSTKKYNYGEPLIPSDPSASCVIATSEVNMHDSRPICTQEGSVYEVSITAISKPFNPAEGSLLIGYNAEKVTADVPIYGAGARVKEIIDYENNKQYNKRRFYYNSLSEFPSNNTSLSRISAPNYYQRIENLAFCNRKSFISNPKYSITASSLTPIINSRASSSAYTVITELLDNGNYGAIERKYFEITDNQPLHFLHEPIYGTPLSNNGSSLYTNRLKEEIYYNADRIPIKKNILEYEVLFHNRIHAMTARRNFIPGNWAGWDWGLPEHSAANYDNYFGAIQLVGQHSEAYYPSGTIKTDNIYEYKNSSTYDLISTERTNSIGQQIKTVYEYPQDNIGKPYANDLVSANRIAEPITIKVYNDGVKILEKETEYGKFENLILPKSVFAGKGSNPLEKKISYDKYDNKGNLLEYTIGEDSDNGIPTSIIWGYDGLHPIALVKGVKYSAIEAEAEAIINQSNEGTLDITSFNEFLNAEDTMFTGFIYKPGIGLSKTIQPNGQSEEYIYDDYGRLKQIRDQDGNILKEHEYHFMNE